MLYRHQYLIIMEKKKEYNKWFEYKLLRHEGYTAFNDLTNKQMEGSKELPEAEAYWEDYKKRWNAFCDKHPEIEELQKI